MIGALHVRSVMNVTIPMISVLTVVDVTMSSMTVITAAIAADVPNVWNTAVNVIGVWIVVSMKDRIVQNAETVFSMPVTSAQDVSNVITVSANGVISADCAQTVPKRITVPSVMHAEVMSGFV